jgi:hypothetical protein
MFGLSDGNPEELADHLNQDLVEIKTLLEKDLEVVEQEKRLIEKILDDLGESPELGVQSLTNEQLSLLKDRLQGGRDILKDAHEKEQESTVNQEEERVDFKDALGTIDKLISLVDE